MRTTNRWRLAQKAEFTWWKAYLNNKDVDTYLKWKRGYWRKILERVGSVIQFPEKGHILDAACGPAGIYMILNDYHVDAVDPLIQKYESALDHFEKDRYPNVCFIQSTIEEYRPRKKFDAVFCMNGINHVSDIDLAWSTLCSSIRSEGYLIVTMDAHKYNLLKRIFRWIPGDVLHPHQYELPEYKAFIENQSCTILHTDLWKREKIFDHYLIIAQKV